MLLRQLNVTKSALSKAAKTWTLSMFGPFGHFAQKAPLSRQLQQEESFVAQASQRGNARWIQHNQGNMLSIL